MLFFVFLSCTLIMIIILQIKSLMHTGFGIYEPLRSIHFSFEISHSIIVLINNSLLFREPPTFVFQLNIFIHLNFCKHCRLRCYYLEFLTKRNYLYFQSIKLQLRRYGSGYLWNRKLRRMPVDSVQVLTSKDGTQIEPS